MDLSKIMSISGYPGLYKLIAKAKNGFIVESLADKKRIQAFNHFKSNTLDGVQIFGKAEDMPIADVFKKIYENSKEGPCCDGNASEEDQKEHLQLAFPDFDETRVHKSDIKKLFIWYNLLQKNDLLKEVENSNENSTEEEKPKELITSAKTGMNSNSRMKAENKPMHVSSKGARKTTTVRKTGA